MSKIHQIICGDNKGGYDLLNSTLPINIAERLSSSTDLIDRPSSGLTGSVIRGICVDEFFLFIKSFPDNRAKIRSGRVFSHALVIEKIYLNKIERIGSLANYFVDRIDVDAAIYPIEFEAVNRNASLETRPVIAESINSIVEHLKYDNTIVWIEEDGYLNWIDQIWSSLSIRVKSKMRLGFAHNPNNIDSDLLNLVYINDSIKNKWERTRFKVLIQNEEEQLNSRAAHFLVADKDKSTPLYEIADNFNFQFEEIDDLLQLDRAIGSNSEDFTKWPFKSLIGLVHLISNRGDNENIGTKGRKQLLKATILALPLTNTDEFLFVKNPDWSGFKNFDKDLLPSVEAWIKQNLFSQKKAGENFKVVKEAILDRDESWWATPIINYLKLKLGDCKEQCAKVVWEWQSKFDGPPVALFEFLQDDAENIIVAHMPSNVSVKNVTALLEFSRKNRWKLFHAYLIGKKYPAKIALERQLEIDTDPEYLDGFTVLSKSMASKTFINASIEFDDVRLCRLSSYMILKKPTLLNVIDVKSAGWQSLWLQVINDRKGVIWDGIRKPIDVLFSILDQLKNNNPIKPLLIFEVSKSEYADIYEYPNRAEIWSKMNEPGLGNFLNATAITIIQKWLKGDIELDSLESILKRVVESRVFLLSVLESSEIEPNEKVRLFSTFSMLRQDDLISYLTHNRLRSDAALTVGLVIKDQKWRKAANYSYQNLKSRPDLKDVIKLCSPLFSVIQRFNLTFIHGMNGTIDEADKIRIFTDTAIDLYPQGPYQNGLWERSGGSDYTLKLETNGQGKWHDAIRQVKNGRGPTFSGLIEEMLKDYPRQNILNNLKGKL